MKKNLWISIVMTAVTTVLFGLVYPMVVTGLAQLIFPGKANGQLIAKNGTVVGSSIIGQGLAQNISTRVLQPLATVTMPKTQAAQISAQLTRSFLIV